MTEDRRQITVAFDWLPSELHLAPRNPEHATLNSQLSSKIIKLSNTSGQLPETRNYAHLLL